MTVKSQGKWPALKIELRPTSSIKRNPKNSKSHSPDQVEKIGKSFDEFGWTMPILVDEKGVLIAGEGRWLMAQARGIDEVPTVVARGWSDAQKRAYMLADNRLTELGEWDREAVKLEMQDLSAMGFNVDLTGFTLAEFDVRKGGLGSLAEQFGVPPFSVLTAREGWWQDRKRAWLALGIRSELGRGGQPDSGAVMPAGGDVKGAFLKRRGYDKASPGGSRLPAADYSKRKRGDGKGKSIPGTDAKSRRAQA